MRPNTLKAALIKSGLAASILLLASGASWAQTTPQQVNLTAAPTAYTAPDGSAIPMWGYFCGATAFTPATTSTAPCAASNPASVTTAATAGAAATGTWSPVVITIPYTFTTASSTVGTVTTVTTTSTTTLQINLANHLLFTAGTGTNSISTSLVILGQLGGGLGTVGTGCTGGATCTPSPGHASQGVTWSTVNTTPGFTPPAQGPRVRSFGAEVAATAATITTPTMLCFGSCLAGQPGLSPGTYLIQSGTHQAI